MSNSSKSGTATSGNDLTANNSTSSPADAVDSLGRRVWDKEFYTKKAAEKAAIDGDDVDLSLLPEAKKKKLPPPPTQRRHLTQRQYQLHLNSDLGKMKVVTAHTPKQQQGGYWCEVCECLIKDSQAFLDHINGKRHNRLLGMTMKVERVSLQKIREKLKSLQPKESKEGGTVAPLDEQDIESRLEQLRQEEEGRKQRKKEKREKRKREKSGTGFEEMGEDGSGNEEGEGDDEEEDEERRMLRQMGLPINFS